MKKLFGIILAAMLCLTAATAQVKSVSVLGDSYSTFEGYLTPATNEIWYFNNTAGGRTDVTDVRQTWWHQLISRQGWKLCVNNSYSGSTICYTGYNGSDYSQRSFVNRAANLGCPDIIFIFGATNDSWAGSPIGDYKYEDITAADLWQVRPAMARLLHFMTTRYLGTELYFILNDGLKPEINETVNTVCRHYGVDVITLKGIDKKSGHPSIKGMQQIADQITDHLKRK